MISSPASSAIVRDFDDPLRRHAPHVERLVARRERERRDFDARVTEFADCGKCVGERAVAEHLVADGKLHGIVFEVR